MFKHVAGTLTAAILTVLMCAPAAQAQTRESLGYGRLMTNDYFGDGSDRWRTGSWTSSRVWGSGWDGRAPKRFGDLIELRLSSEIFAPDNLTRASAGDRPYAGALSLGAHTHFEYKGFDAAVGADLVVTGAGTGLGNFQRAVHKALGVRVPSRVTLDDQIDGGLHPTVVAEFGREVSVTPNLRLRPFVEGRAGAETMVRAGVDLTFGSVGAGELLVRESVTGHRYRVIQDAEAGGFSFLLGADIAHVASSIYLPEDRGYTLTESRDRLRAGIQWQGERASAFYGVTYLGEEFEAQTEGQVLGSIQIKFSF
ncbi:lipid A-modifier LpxR family protein [Sulfitobacter sp. HNIBRBA2951]|uniref:lipid A-modifier LpxR family protein n=1 Tax=Sulfitobacter aquimarinus TaxID=3158557 RepID=UPI0032DFE042